MQLTEQKLWLKENVETNQHYPEIIGTSPELLRSLQLISRVAPTASTVLLLGETGTGKELVARAIHHHSPRKAKPMVKVNCAALPANLIESELFGHERGSFTGAIDRRIGKFEQAHNSTLFLDEVGELPLELQVKLLRVLQEKEIDRVGGRTPIPVDVRIIAATNRRLEEEVEAGRFRADLYYRLSVFPIDLPALRHRRDDLPLLAMHFIQKLSKKIGKKITMISRYVIDQVLNYDWPGNIRELEHVIERSIILSDEEILKQVYLPDIKKMQSVRPLEAQLAVKSIQQLEKEHIIDVLNRCKWRISGCGGAAESLGIPASTLSSKLKRLGIQKTYY